MGDISPENQIEDWPNERGRREKEEEESRPFLSHLAAISRFLPAVVAVASLSTSPHTIILTPSFVPVSGLSKVEVYRDFKSYKLRDWAVWQARACCYSWAVLSSNDSKMLYCCLKLITYVKKFQKHSSSFYSVSELFGKRFFNQVSNLINVVCKGYYGLKQIFNLGISGLHWVGAK